MAKEGFFSDPSGARQAAASPQGAVQILELVTAEVELKRRDDDVVKVALNTIMALVQQYAEQQQAQELEAAAEAASKSANPAKSGRAQKGRAKQPTPSTPDELEARRQAMTADGEEGEGEE